MDVHVLHFRLQTLEKPVEGVLTGATSGPFQQWRTSGMA
jgi:hypothetical protein